MFKKRVLIPIDNSGFSQQILPIVQKHFDPPQTELLLLHVEADQEALHIQRTGIEPLDIFKDQAEYSLRSQFADSMRQTVQQLKAAGFQVETDVAFGKPAPAIEARIARDPFDLIAMATHGRTGLERMLQGSVAEQIMHHVTIPVLFFQATDDGQRNDPRNN